ncbi:DEAD/DEAH box helicase [Pseudoneobacillus sp. C159]
MVNKLNGTYRCPITLTNTAKEKMRELGVDERTFFLLEKSFHVYIEKYPQSADRIVSVALFFDNEMNERIADVCNRQVMVFHCVVKQDRFVATNVTTRGAHFPVQSNWRRPAQLTFEYNVQHSESVPLELLDLIHSMPVMQESSTYVKKRISSWEGYLKIQERTADIPDMTSRYSRLIFNENFSRVTITGCQLKDNEWKLLQDLSVKLKGMDQDIGKVLKANRSAASVEVELHSYMEERARRQQLEVHPREVVFSNFAALSQVKRLRQGFKQLENGLAANPELERLLFENKPPVKSVETRATLQFHNRLNEYQREAVIGAMSAEDLYVIQGPPGTGKTTVISEICLQNAKAGLRTLVASQSNLAVDNALGRLLANKDIRILRVGRTESIEEDGKKFIEENVGQYWKDHTLQEVSNGFENRKQREKELVAEWQTNEQEYERLQQVLVRVEEDIATKKVAEQQYSVIQSTLTKLKKDVQTAVDEEQAIKQQIQDYEQTLRLLTETIEEDQEFLANLQDVETIEKELQAKQQELVRLQKSVNYQELEEEILQKKQSIEQISAESEKWKLAVTQDEALLGRITSAKKIDNLKWMILEVNLNRTQRIQQGIEEIEGIRYEISQLDKLKAYNDKLNRAIAYVEHLLDTQKMPMYQLQERMKNVQAIKTSSSEIDQFLDRLRSELKQNTKMNLQRLVIFLEGLYSRRHFIWHKGRRLKPFEVYVRTAHALLQDLKQEMLVQLQATHEDHRLILQKWQRANDVANQELFALQNRQKEMGPPAEIIPNSKEVLREFEARLHELEKMKLQHGQTMSRVEMNVKKREEVTGQKLVEERNWTQKEASLAELKYNLGEKEAELLPLHDIISTTPEQEHETVLRDLASVSFTREKLKQEKQKLPLFQAIQGKWLSLLKDTNDHDLNEIRKLYVKHANVIGTTCVASARKDFIESYPIFDVVIIDEVSKATPPELLLPMLKGKKIILVGDHHQLPPLLGDDTLEETLQEMAEESNDFAGKTELKQLLHESLFERLFKNLPNSHKTMLGIQYRMHESIMGTISQFYQQDNGGLQCGLTDSNLERDHKLESAHIHRSNHLLWLDMPNEPAFFEERMKSGKSLYNQAELKRIAELLTELDEAVSAAKQARRMSADEKKSIGVISFYGEQVKRIDRMIQQELHLPHLTIRTGTVDRFQGMEMDVIVLSMVRNHDNKQDDIGFAKDYRRLNVALSRARELLVLIGSTKMFTERPKQKQTRQMYTNVLEAVKRQEGHRTLEEVSLYG